MKVPTGLASGRGVVDVEVDEATADVEASDKTVFAPIHPSSSLPIHRDFARTTVTKMPAKKGPSSHAGAVVTRAWSSIHRVLCLSPSAHHLTCVVAVAVSPSL